LRGFLEPAALGDDVVERARLGVAGTTYVDEVLQHDLGSQLVPPGLLLLFGKLGVGEQRVGLGRRLALVPKEDVDAGDALQPTGELASVGK